MVGGTLASIYMLHASQMSMSLISNQKTYVRDSQSVQRSKGLRVGGLEVWKCESARQ